MMEELILSAVDNLREEVIKLQNDIFLMKFDIEQIRVQLDRIESGRKQPQESIGIVPTLPPDYLPPELM